MPRWFVHIDEPYYPSAAVVEADDVEGAILAAWKASGSGPGYFEDRISFAVFPLDAGEFAGEPARVWSLMTGNDEDEYRFRDDEDYPRRVEIPELPQRALPPSIIGNMPPPSSFRMGAPTFMTIDLTPPSEESK